MQKLDKRTKATVVKLHPWKRESGLIGVHIGDGQLGVAPKKHIHLHGIAVPCGGELHYRSFTPHHLTGYTNGLVECNKCEKKVYVNLHEPDVIAQWCWTVVVTWMWKTAPEQYRAMVLGHSRLIPDTSFFWHAGELNPALLLKGWLAMDTIVLVAELTELATIGEIQQNVLRAFSSLEQVVSARFREAQELARKSHSSIGWIHLR